MPFGAPRRSASPLRAPAPSPALAALLLAACAQRAPLGTEVVLDQRGGAHAERYDALEAEREHTARAYDAEARRLAAAFEAPLDRPVEGGGILRIEGIELRGGPDRPHLRARFTFQNTTEDSLPIPTLTLYALSPGGRIRASESLRLERILEQRVPRAATHTAWIEVPLGDLYLVPGWDWALDATYGD